MALGAAHADAGWRLDLQAGGFIPVQHVKYRDDGTKINEGIGGGGAFVVGGAYGLGDWVELTAQLQAATNFDSYDNTVGVVSFTPGARVFLLPKDRRVRPWLGGQVGWYHLDGNFDYEVFGGDYEAEESDDSFGLNVGGGVDFRINHRVSLGLDVRYHNAFDALDGFQFLTTCFNVGIHFGD